MVRCALCPCVAHLDLVGALCAHRQATSQEVLATLQAQLGRVEAVKADERKTQEDLATAVSVVRLTSEEYRAKEGDDRHGGKFAGMGGDDFSPELLEEMFRRTG